MGMSCAAPFRHNLSASTKAHIKDPNVSGSFRRMHSTRILFAAQQLFLAKKFFHTRSRQFSRLPKHINLLSTMLEWRSASISASAAFFMALPSVSACMHSIRALLKRFAKHQCSAEQNAFSQSSLMQNVPIASTFECNILMIRQYTCHA